MTRRAKKTELSRERQDQARSAVSASVRANCPPMARLTESPPDELECKICYNQFDTGSREPKVLACLHRLCAKCLKRMLDVDLPPARRGDARSSSSLFFLLPVLLASFFFSVSFPPPSRVFLFIPSFLFLPVLLGTCLPCTEVWLMEDDRHILAVLSCGERARRGGEVVLCPDSLTGTEQAPRHSDYLVITIMELPAESPASDSLSALNATAVTLYRQRDSLACDLPAHKCDSWTSGPLPHCLLGSLCLVYFSSLPVGIYLLMMAHTWPGVLLVSLVPSTLLLLVLYGFCQCLCHKLLEALATHCHDNATIAITSEEDE